MRSQIIAAFALATGIVLAAPAPAQEMKPMAAHRVVLDDMTGVVFYTAERDGFRVVATFAGEDGEAMRFNATLSDHQSMSIAVPRGTGEMPAEVLLTREADRMLIETARQASY